MRRTSGQRRQFYERSVSDEFEYRESSRLTLGAPPPIPSAQQHAHGAQGEDRGERGGCGRHPRER